MCTFKFAQLTAWGVVSSVCMVILSVPILCRNRRSSANRTWQRLQGDNVGIDLYMSDSQDSAMNGTDGERLWPTKIADLDLDTNESQVHTHFTARKSQAISRHRVVAGL